MINPDFDISGLVCAMAEQAARQAQKGDRSAALWLATDGAFMLECVNADEAAYRLGSLAREILAKPARKANPSRKNTAQPGRGRKLERMPVDAANVYA